MNIDLFTYDDLEALRKKRQGGSVVHQPANMQLANKRYLILTYNAEYDRIYYPLSLPYCGKPDPVVLMQQVRQLTAENRLLKSRVKISYRREFRLDRLFCLFVFSLNRMLNEVILFVFNASRRIIVIEIQFARLVSL